MPKLAEALAKNIEFLRRQRKLSKEALAQLIGATRQTIWSYEKGEGHISADMISKLASALGVEETELVKTSPEAEKVELSRDAWHAIKSTLEQEKHSKPTEKSTAPAPSSIPEEVIKKFNQLSEPKNSWDLLRKRLNEELAAYGAVAEFCRKLQTSRTAVERWLKPREEGGGAPSLENLDAIAKALNCHPSDLIKPENQAIPRSHTLDDCLKAISEAVKGEPSVHAPGTSSIEKSHEKHSKPVEKHTPASSSFPEEMTRKLNLLSEPKRKTLLRLWNGQLDRLIPKKDETG